MLLKTLFTKNKKKEDQIVDSSWRRWLNKKNVGDSEQSMIVGILNCKNIMSRDVMIPRVDVIAIDLQHNKKQILEQIASSSFSRFPVYKDSIDNVVGVLHLRDITISIMKKKKKFELEKYLKEIYFVPEAKPILDVLKDMQKMHLHLAVVVDEYGGFSGIITMEDILEEIIGDILDEWDADKSPIVKVKDDEWNALARIDLEDVSSLVGVTLTDENADTLGGLVVNLFGKVPRSGETIEDENFIYTVKSKRGNSPLRIHLKNKKNSTTPEN